MTKQIAIAALVACLGLCGALWRMSGVVDRLRDDNDTLKAALAGCSAKALNQSEDKESDDAVDNMPDLRDVPDSWLLPEPGAGGIY